MWLHLHNVMITVLTVVFFFIASVVPATTLRLEQSFPMELVSEEAVVVIAVVIVVVIVVSIVVVIG